MVPSTCSGCAGFRPSELAHGCGEPRLLPHGNQAICTLYRMPDWVTECLALHRKRACRSRIRHVIQAGFFCFLRSLSGLISN